MNKAFIEEQRNAAQVYLESLSEGREDMHKVTIIFQYLSSLTMHEKFSDVQKEDLRKLAFELGYRDNTSFSEWQKTLH